MTGREEAVVSRPAGRERREEQEQFRNQFVADAVSQQVIVSGRSIYERQRCPPPHRQVSICTWGCLPSLHTHSPAMPPLERTRKIHHPR